MSEYTLYIDGIEYGEFKFFDAAKVCLDRVKSNYGRAEICATYHIANSDKKARIELVYLLDKRKIK